MSRVLDPQKILIPQVLRTNLIDLFGQCAEEWFVKLPRLLEDLRARWELDYDQVFENMKYGFVIGARMRSGGSAVLKLGVPSQDLIYEKDCLEAFKGNGMVKLLHFDLDKGALLIERCWPGRTLKSLFLEGNDREACLIAADVIRRFQAAPPSSKSFPNMKDLFGAFQRVERRSSDTKLLESVRKAGSLLRSIDGVEQNILLHGDLHHDNILKAERDNWLAIDPEGVIGSLGYEIGAFLINPRDELPAVKSPMYLIQFRLEIFSSELKIPSKELRVWGFIRAALCACWSFEDHGAGWEPWLKIADLIDEA